MKIRDLYFWVFLAATGLGVLPGRAFGQVSFAAIKGTITDPSGNAINDARVAVLQRQTGIGRTAETQQRGLYQIESLEPGEYELEVSSPGFEKAAYRLTLRAGDYLTVNVPLELGRLSETVAVTGEVSGINTSDFALTGNVSRTQLENLPLNGRNVLELARLEPGVSVVSVANPGAFGNNYQRVSIGGAPYLETRVGVDSATADDRINGGTSLNISQESVQEFQIASFNFDLSTGATGSGAVNIITRRGTNKFHGKGFFYYRDNNLAAYPALRRNSEHTD
ncbi:MAG TPA: carboxypeptidase regulatory-like domain-containing protein, partial [Terriglobia bacterium]|nr:carboxypeptidase regulatory-like domain-containing protein [Terriglobia bacterium]